eukprot:TRINITY_DN50117_c0_g1_i1.p1 TRINITY_DN50117_c0_g1~~TRINITY_DN50117_c0_g1_i1.p1  ORF type:complete len:474 (+),score=105.64 TRINITY_DN50117_c0_g1_i1:76-1422(+)
MVAPVRHAGQPHSCAPPPGTFRDHTSGRSIAPANAAFDRAAHWEQVLISIMRGTAEHHTQLYHSLYGRGGRGRWQAPAAAEALSSLVGADEGHFAAALRAALAARSWGSGWLPEALALLLRCILAARDFAVVAAPWEPTAAGALGDPLHLPTRLELLAAFGMWPPCSALPRPGCCGAAPSAGGSLPDPEDWWVNGDGDLAELIERHTALHASGEAEAWQSVNALAGSFACPSALSHWSELHDWHDCITQEYVGELALWIAATAPPDSVIVEVGCGRGRLAYHLSAALRPRGFPGGVVATDSDAFDDPSAPGHVPGVRRMPCQVALHQLQPSVVLCAWMPAGDDWTPAFRACTSVQQYVLLGPPGVSATAAAWGAPAAGWQRRRLRRVERQAVCKLDCALDPGNSRAVAFLRGHAPAGPPSSGSSCSSSEEDSEELPASAPHQRLPEEL